MHQKDSPNIQAGIQPGGKLSDDKPFRLKTARTTPLNQTGQIPYLKTYLKIYIYKKILTLKNKVNVENLNWKDSSILVDITQFRISQWWEGQKHGGNFAFILFNHWSLPFQEIHRYRQFIVFLWKRICPTKICPVVLFLSPQDKLSTIP